MSLTASVKWDKRASLADNARRELPRLVSAYFAEVREQLAQESVPRELHRLRLASKRLRYTVELFRGCYPEGLEERLGALKAVQDWLGEVNDAVVTAEMLREALRRRPKVRKFLEARAAENAAGFVRHWKETFDAPGQEAWWTEFLARPLEKAAAPQTVEAMRPRTTGRPTQQRKRFGNSVAGSGEPFSKL